MGAPVWNHEAGGEADTRLNRYEPMMKVYRLKSALRKPFLKAKAFGIPVSQIYEYDVIQAACSYVDEETGKLAYPGIHQIKTSVVKYNIENGHYRKFTKHGPELVLIPIRDWEVLDEQS